MSVHVALYTSLKDVCRPMGCVERSIDGTTYVRTYVRSHHSFIMSFTCLASTFFESTPKSQELFPNLISVEAVLPRLPIVPIVDVSLQR